jgi:hypothetical protein
MPLERLRLLAWLAACGSAGHAVAAHNSQSRTPAETARPVSSPATQATDIPILHEGTTVKLPYVTEMAGTQGAQVIENTAWKLTSIGYISQAQATLGGTDGDTASGLGANGLKAGDRYLVLGLTVDDSGPSGFDNDFPLGNADFVTVYRSGGKEINGQTDAYCMSETPPGTQPPAGAQFASDICSTNTLQPGQTFNGYVFFEVPDTPSLLFIVGNAGTQDGKPILAIDPDNLVAKPVCDGNAAFC